MGELEKFKFVLDYKIKELKAQIDPKNDSISQMKKKIQEMDELLEDFHKKNKQLQLDITQLTGKQKLYQEEILKFRKKLTDGQTVIDSRTTCTSAFSIFKSLSSCTRKLRTCIRSTSLTALSARSWTR